MSPLGSGVFTAKWPRTYASRSTTHLVSITSGVSANTSAPNTTPNHLCTLPTRAPRVLTPPAHGSNAINQLLRPTQSHALFFLSREMDPDEFSNCRAHINVKTNRRTQAQDVTFKDSYEVLLPSTSQVEEPKNAPRHLMQLQEQQQQRVESKTLRAPGDLKDTIVALKRARASTLPIEGQISHPYNSRRQEEECFR